jgi:TRAP-type C4-dicarboxylate transport system substrate-binding protein
MYQPLLMNKSAYDGLNDAQKTALRAAAAKAEAFYLEQAKLADAAATQTFRDAGVEIAEMTQADFDAWLEVAQRSSFPSFVEGTPDGQRLLDMALAVE